MKDAYSDVGIFSFERELFCIKYDTIALSILPPSNLLSPDIATISIIFSKQSTTLTSNVP